MKHLELFEEYNATTHKNVIMVRKIMNNKTVRKILRILSIIHDLVNFNFGSIKSTFKNKEGCQKLCDLSTEFALTVKVLREEDREGTTEEELFQAIKDYGIDVQMILDNLKDQNVQNFLRTDRIGRKHLEKYSETFEFLKRYLVWNGDYETEDEIDVEF